MATFQVTHEQAMLVLNDIVRTGTSMSIVLPRLSRLSDERDQAAVKKLVDEWDQLIGLKNSPEVRAARV